MCRVGVCVGVRLWECVCASPLDEACVCALNNLIESPTHKNPLKCQNQQGNWTWLCAGMLKELLGKAAWRKGRGGFGECECEECGAKEQNH